MASIIWDPKVRDFLRKLPKNISKRIFRKVDSEIKENVGRYLKSLIDREEYKIRIGDYRLFVNYDKNKNQLIIHSIRHRKDAYKKNR
ncbi:MAG: type II toxin-antitoxin system RelE/ParE family toxin [Candidatus Falkowbacteria bacterium]